MTSVVVSLWIIASFAVGLSHGGCNQKHVARRNEVAYLTSPGYPGNFTQNVDCYYEVYSTSDNPGLIVHIDVIDVTLRCDDDNTQLLVYDRFSHNPRFLGKICMGGQRTFESPKQTLYLTFRTRAEHAERSRGFRLRVRTEPRYCHCYTQKTAVMEVTSTPSVLTTPFYPYTTAGNVECRWLLKAPQESRVNITLLHTDMKGSDDCSNFGLYIYDGKTTYDDKMLATVCDNSLQSFHSSGPYLLVVFSSGHSVYASGGGVKLQYTALPVATGTDRQLIGQTLFFVITALLILVISVISFLAAVKLFLLPRRRKQAERRRRAARARLTRISRSSSSSCSSSQSESASHSGSGRAHASCSRASSSTSGASEGSQHSLTRLLSLYGLKKCRHEHRCSSRTVSQSSYDNPQCLYNSQRSGVVMRASDFSSMCLHDCFPAGGDLPPSYEEAVSQGALIDILLQQAALEEAERRAEGGVAEGAGPTAGHVLLNQILERPTLQVLEEEGSSGPVTVGEESGQSALQGDVARHDVFGESRIVSLQGQDLAERSGLQEVEEHRSPARERAAAIETAPDAGAAPAGEQEAAVRHTFAYVEETLVPTELGAGEGMEKVSGEDVEETVPGETELCTLPDGVTLNDTLRPPVPEQDAAERVEQETLELCHLSCVTGDDTLQAVHETVVGKPGAEEIEKQAEPMTSQCAAATPSGQGAEGYLAGQFMRHEEHSHTAAAEASREVTEHPL